MSSIQPPNELELQLSGKPYKAHPEAPGTYKLQDYYVNDLPVWKKTPGKHVIWYSGPYDHWCVSRSRDLGSDIFMIVGPGCVKDWPNKIINLWSYYSENSLIRDDSTNIKFIVKNMSSDSPKIQRVVEEFESVVSWNCV